MINNVTAGDKVFFVLDPYNENATRCAESFAISIYEETVFAIVDFGHCKKIAFANDGYSVEDYLKDDNENIFKNYDDALEYAKNRVYEHFIRDETGRGNNNA